jgi:hypothetical protein
LIDYSVASVRKQEPVELLPFHEFRLEDGTVWTEFYRLHDGYLLRFPDLADFEVSPDGASVTALPTPDIDDITLEHLYINQVVPLALSRQGRPAFHASAVTVPGGCIAFLGKTGMGKSTLAASFALSGAAFLTDDSLIIEQSNEALLVLPSHASVRLWEDSLEALSSEQARYDVAYSSKTRILAGDELEHAAEAQRLLAAYRLEDREPGETVINPLAGTDLHMAWIENSFLLDIQDKDLLARHFDWTHRISGRVPCFSLDYPRIYGMLEEVRQTILQHVAGLND